MSIYSEIIYNKVWRIVIVIKQIGLDWFQVLQLLGDVFFLRVNFYNKYFKLKFL